jgi:hypothetical protein
VNGTVILPPLVFPAISNGTKINFTMQNDTQRNGLNCGAQHKRDDYQNVFYSDADCSYADCRYAGCLLG